MPGVSCSEAGDLRLGTGEDVRFCLSDLDFLVEFEPLPAGEYSTAFFAFKEAMERLFGLPVDLVVPSAIRNPYFRQSVEQSKALLYAA